MAMTREISNSAQMNHNVSMADCMQFQVYCSFAHQIGRLMLL